MSLSGVQLSQNSLFGNGGSIFRDKISQQLESIAKKTNKNLNQGVYKNPN